MATLTITRLGPTFGAVVRGVVLREIDRDVAHELYEAWLQYGLLIFPEQHLSHGEQVAFARYFGELEFELCAIGNVDERERVHTDPGDPFVKAQRANEGWHHDSSYMPVLAKGAVVSAEFMPSTGGATGWADMCAAYDVLDAETRGAIQGLSAYHSLYYSQLKGNGVYPRTHAELRRRLSRDGIESGRLASTALRPLTSTHPTTGRQGLLVGQHAFGIPGLDPEVSESLLAKLMRQACRAPRVYYHRWTPGDAAVWDNVRLAHRATQYDASEPRRMWHTRIAGHGEPVDAGLVAAS